MKKCMLSLTEISRWILWSWCRLGEQGGRIWNRLAWADFSWNLIATNFSGCICHWSHISHNQKNANHSHHVSKIESVQFCCLSGAFHNPALWSALFMKYTDVESHLARCCSCFQPLPLFIQCTNAFLLRNYKVITAWSLTCVLTTYYSW